jgi:DNA-binding response OmpR family regulator
MQSILVVEDDHSIRVTLREALEAQGYLVFSAANGADGLAQMSRIKGLSCILLDWQMPLVNGEDFLKGKMKEEAFASIPVILVSAVADRIHPIGVKEIIPKPFEIDRLLAAIEKYALDEPESILDSKKTP